MTWPATRFDGRSAAGEAVEIGIERDSLTILASTGERRVRLAEIDIGEAFARAPRMLALPDGGTIEVPDPQRDFSAALLDAGVRPSWVERLQGAWGAVVIALALLIASGIWIYVEGLPIAARYVAERMPAGFERSLGDNVLELLDRSSLKRSRLSAEERERIAARFAAAAALAAPGVDVRLEFRRGQLNAFALPGGIIVLFDEIVRFAEDDEQVLAVLGHELGHVVRRHSTRQLLQALGVGAVAGLVWGDFSTVAANAPVVLGVMRYGRGFEVEADAFALEFLRTNGLSPRPMYEFMARIREAKEPQGDQIPAFLSTHPEPSERVERLRRETEAYEAQVAK